MFKCYEERKSPIMEAFKALSQEEREVMDKALLHEWYRKRYPSDAEMADRMDPEVTIGGVVRCFHNEVYSYAAFFADDSIVRERVFEGITQMMHCDYDVMCNMWLRTAWCIDPCVQCEYTISVDNEKGTMRLQSPLGVVTVWEDVVLGGHYGAWTEVRERQYVVADIKEKHGMLYGPHPLRAGLLRTDHWGDKRVDWEWVEKNKR